MLGFAVHLLRRLLYSPSGPWTHDPPLSVSQVLGLQVCITICSTWPLQTTCFSLFPQSTDGNYPTVNSVLWVITPNNFLPGISNMHRDTLFSRSSLSKSLQKHLVCGVGREAILWPLGWLFRCWRSCQRLSHFSLRWLSDLKGDAPQSVSTHDVFFPLVDPLSMMKEKGWGLGLLHNAGCTHSLSYKQTNISWAVLSRVTEVRKNTLLYLQTGA